MSEIIEVTVRCDCWESATIEIGEGGEFVTRDEGNYIQSWPVVYFEFECPSCKAKRSIRVNK